MPKGVISMMMIPILVTLVGIVTVVSDVHAMKAPLPNDDDDDDDDE